MDSFKFIFFSNNLSKQYLFVSFIIFLFFQDIECNSQMIFRRHFIIACDASRSYNSRNQATIVNTQRWLESYFKNEFQPGVNGRFDIIREEFRNGKLRFDPFKDEITFYNFNLTDNDITKIIAGKQDSLSITSKIPELFFKNTKIHWTTFPYRNIYEYFRNTYNPVYANRELTNFTIPNLVYPLILNNIVTTTFAEEYILIILTSTPPEPLNIVDLYELKSRIRKENLAENFLNNQIKSLSLKFTQTDYFNCPDYGIFAYFITPKNVNPGTTTTAISVDPNIKLTQKGYKKNEYQFSTMKVNFPENKHLVPAGMHLKIIEQTKNNGDTIFAGVVNKKYFSEKWILRFFHNISLLKNKTSFSYNIKNFEVNLDSLNVKTDNIKFNSLKLSLDFKCQVQTLGNNALNYLFYIESLIPIRKIDYITDFEHRFTTLILPVSTILFILTILIVLFIIASFRGKIKELKLNIEGFNDNYMLVENQEVYKSDCWFYRGDRQSSIGINGEIIYNDYKCMLKVKPEVECKIDEYVNNDEFEYTVNDDWINNGCNKWISIEAKGDKYRFNVNVRVKKGEPNFDKLNKLGIKVTIKVSSKLFGIFSLKEKTIDDYYPFCVHEYIGKLWVGLDPGTCGSCFAVGNGGPITQPDIFEVYINTWDKGQKVRKNIIPSKLILDNPSIINKSPDQMDPDKDYKWGFEAESKWIANVNSGYGNCYQSIKKLLGYKLGYKNTREDENNNAVEDLIIAQFKDNNTKKFKGVELSYLLLKGLMQILDDYLNNTMSPDDRRRLDPNGGLPKPLRAVVAVPNNFTLPRIQDMVDSIKKLGRFKEIRYIYETEGILFYYMSKNLPSEIETVMVYDMGGATINASIFKIIPPRKGTKKLNYYVVETLGRIGFTGGGDNVDVALMDSIFKIPCVKRAFEQQKGLKTEDDIKQYQLNNKSIILALMYELKLDIVDLISNTKANKSWSNAKAFSSVLKRYLELKLDESDWKEEDKVWLSRVEDYVIKLVASNDFEDYVYGKVREAVSELVKSVFKSESLKIEKRIDKIIFSGRSILFPNIKNKVVETLKMENITYDEWTGFESSEIKSAVAYGACWSGMYNNMVHLDHTHVTSNYGFLKTNTAGITDFIEVIKMNSKFDNRGLIDEKINYEDNFAEDGSQIDFYQIMGADPNNIVKKIIKNKHKMNFLGRANVIANHTESIRMSLDNKDNIKYEVNLPGGEVIKSTDLKINTRDITHDNDWAYVFSVSDDEIKNRVNPALDNENIV